VSGTNLDYTWNDVGMLFVCGMRHALVKGACRMKPCGGTQRDPKKSSMRKQGRRCKNSTIVCG
jgi:hypothetical protein